VFNHLNSKKETYYDDYYWFRCRWQTVSDERSAYMTRSHNNARMITMGAEIVGDTLAKNVAKEFVNGHYDGGRHQIRVDMLNKMC